MKTLLTLALISTLTFCGCASFRTEQRDVRISPDGTTTEIVTIVRARTFGTSKSSLTSFTATQTEKSQGAKVGALAQESNGTNAVAIAERVSKAVTEAVLKSFVPVP